MSQMYDKCAVHLLCMSRVCQSLWTVHWGMGFQGMGVAHISRPWEISWWRYSDALKALSVFENLEVETTGCTTD